MAVHGGFDANEVARGEDPVDRRGGLTAVIVVRALAPLVARRAHDVAQAKTRRQLRVNVGAFSRVEITGDHDRQPSNPTADPLREKPSRVSQRFGLVVEMGIEKQQRSL